MRSRADAGLHGWPAIEFNSTAGRLGSNRQAVVPLANADRLSFVALMAVRSTTFGIIVSKRRTSAPNAGWNLQSNGTTGNLQFTRIGTTSLDYITNNTPLAAFLSRKRWAWILCEYNEDYGAGTKVRISARDYFGGRWIDGVFGTATDGATYTDDSGQGMRIGNNQGGGAGNAGRLISLCAVTNPLPIGILKSHVDRGDVLALRKHAISFFRPGAWMQHALDEGRFTQGLASSESWRLASTYGTDWKVSQGPPYLLVDRAFDLEEQDEEATAASPQTITPAAASVTVTAPTPTIAGSGAIAIAPAAAAVGVSVPAATFAAGGAPQTIAPAAASIGVTVPAATLAGSGAVPFAPAAAAISVTVPAATLAGAGAAPFAPAAAAVSVTVPTSSFVAGGAPQTILPAAAAVTITAPASSFGLGTIAITQSAAAVTVTAPSASFLASGIAIASPSPALVAVVVPGAIFSGGLFLVGVRLTAIAMTGPSLAGAGIAAARLEGPALEAPALTGVTLTI